MSRRPTPILAAALALALCAVLALDGCRREGQVNPGASAGSTNLWTWMSGSTSAGGRGVYGTQRTAASSNLPGARQGAASWRDTNGNLWLYGGLGVDSVGNTGYLNDLWRYSPSTALWTWMAGTNLANVAGNYGTRTVGTTSTIPGSRSDATTWTDAQGHFWLMGGSGYDSTGIAFGPLNDLWEFDPVAVQWTWQSGASTYLTTAASYGTQGVAAASNVPGGRSMGQSWVDSTGVLWLFGGSGQDATNTLGNLSDVWKFSTISGEWTWVEGSTAAGTAGNYGTKGNGTATTAPGGRSGAATWHDAAGNTWMFGGSGDDSRGTAGHLSDLWQLNPSGIWTWVGGSNLAEAAATYGSLGAPSAANLPGGRIGAAAWIDASGLLAMTGGQGNDSAALAGYLSDVWRYNATSGTWTWTGGSNLANQAGRYGSMGVTASSNLPGGRYDAARWVDSSGHLWQFGGKGYDSAGTVVSELDDLWTLTP
jgi:hypothetical protein